MTRSAILVGMTLLIGVDEAGYGPNYGPLAVAATAWRVAEQEGGGFRVQGSAKAGKNGLSVGAETKRAVASSPTARVPDLYKLLRRAVVRSPDTTRCQKVTWR